MASHQLHYPVHWCSQSKNTHFLSILANGEDTEQDSSEDSHQTEQETTNNPVLKPDISDNSQSSWKGTGVTKRITDTSQESTMLPLPVYIHSYKHQLLSNLEIAHFLFKLSFWYPNALLHNNMEKFRKVQKLSIKKMWLLNKVVESHPLYHI